MRKRIERVEVVAATRTSANLLWYTPGRMAGTALKWGPTAEYGETYSSSEFELVHTVSLVNLRLPPRLPRPTGRGNRHHLGRPGSEATETSTMRGSRQNRVMAAPFYWDLPPTSARNQAGVQGMDT